MALRRLQRPISFHWWRPLALVLVVVLGWMVHHDRWTPASWQVPLEYHADALEMLGRIQAASEGTGLPLRPQVVSRLGAPFEAPWNDYPASDKVLVLFLGSVARVIGVGAAANFGLLLAQVLAVLSFYGCARVLRIRWEWAAVGALLFACSYGTFARGLGHMLLVFNWTLPPGLLACAFVAGRTQLKPWSARALFCVVIGFVFGISNPYNLYFWLQLFGWAVVAQALGARRWQNLLVGMVTIGIAVVAFAIANAEIWLYPTDPGARELVERNYGGTEQYALKPIELITPPTDHRVPVMAFFGHRYLRWSDWRGEALMAYLGVVGALGLCALLALAVVRALRGRRIPAPALQVGWLIGFASVGSLSNVLAFYLGFQVFRATNRVSFLVLPIVLLFLGRYVSRATRTWPAGGRLGLAAVVLVIGLLDQVPRPATEQAREAVAAAFHADQVLGGVLEKELGPGAMIFQLPVFGFVEAPPLHQLSGYEHLRLYLATGTLRFSYGIPKFRAMAEWQEETEQMPVAQMVERLEESGFAGVALLKRGYEDGGAAIREALAELGYQTVWEDPQGEHLVVPLRPRTEPTVPLADRATFGRGWHSVPLPEPDSTPIWWAYGPAVLNYFNPLAESLPVHLRGEVRVAGDRHVVLHVNGDPLWQTDLREATSTQFELTVSLRPGVNRLDVMSPEPAVRRDQERYSLRSVGIDGIRVERVPPGYDVPAEDEMPAPSAQTDEDMAP